MTRWDTDNLNAAHTQRELDQEWGPVIDFEIGGGNVFADLGFENADVMALQSENKGLRDRIEQLERGLAKWHESYWELDHNYRIEASSLSSMLEQSEAELAAEKALADRLYSVLSNTDVSTGYCCCGDPVDSHSIGSGHSPVDEGSYHAGLACAAYRKARGL